MKVAVCVKQIPDPADPGALDETTKTLKRDTKLILDESDSYGVEMALQLVDAVPHVLKIVLLVSGFGFSFFSIPTLASCS